MTHPDADADVLVFTKYANDIPRFRTLLRSGLPDQRIAFATTPAEAAPHLHSARILYGWGFPLDMVKAMPRLQWIQKMGAGVEDLSGGRWPFGDGVVLTRTDGRLIAPRMVEYVTWAILHQTLLMNRIRAECGQGHWSYTEIGSVRQHTVGVAGLGEIGTEIARNLRSLGAHVVGWKRTPGACDAVHRVFAGQTQFADFLSCCSVLVLVLPATSETAGLLNSSTLSLLRRGAHLINVGRGPVVDEAALLQALQDGRISHATLDVFATEPLPPHHPFWTHPQVTITPHIAGPLIPEDVAPHFIDNFKAFQAKRPLKNLVRPERQY